MICSCCKYSRNLRYIDTVDVRLPYDTDVSRVQVLNILTDYMFCVAKRRVVQSNVDRYCESARHIFDD